ncbi:MAG: hypothetical protein ACREQY_14215, partial [Candidatus Binatia bacterium]
VNIIADMGRAGRVSADELRKLTDDAYQAKIAFLREETRRAGRDPRSVRVSNVLFSFFLVDSEAAAGRMAERLAPVFGTPPDLVRQSPLVLLGTPEQLVLELKRRIGDWGVDQFVFSGGAHTVMRRLREDVLAHV